MTILILGASGATGKLLVQQALESGFKIKIIVRTTAQIPDYWKTKNEITIIRENISTLLPQDFASHLKECNAVASCLGHNLSLKGIFGKPRNLVRNAVKLVSEANKINQKVLPLKLIVMNTAGCRNRAIPEKISCGQKIVVGLIRMLLPPHNDNEGAAAYLHEQIGQNNKQIQWVIVRPDSLLNEQFTTEYSVHPSPTRSAIFNAGKTSRINLAHFMTRLLKEDDLWKTWQGQMPVVYNI